MGVWAPVDCSLRVVRVGGIRVRRACEEHGVLLPLDVLDDGRDDRCAVNFMYNQRKYAKMK